MKRADGSFGERTYVRFKEPPLRKEWGRGTSRPYLVDWNGDGHTDLVIGYPGTWAFEVALGPLLSKKAPGYLPTTSVKLPPVRNAQPIHFAFADWDGDGRMDLLVGVESTGPQPTRYSVYWFRNTSAKGPPRFADGVRLLDIPQPWELHAFAAVAWGGDRLPGLVVSVSQGQHLGEGGSGWWPNVSELQLYRRKAEPNCLRGLYP